jgi:hypothetical protein
VAWPFAAVHTEWKVDAMVRARAGGLVLVVIVLAGCASRGSLKAKPPDLPRPGDLATEEQRLLACLDLRDHIVSLYADAYVEEQGLDMSNQERDAFRSGWGEELAKKGTFERFEQACVAGVTSGRYHCGMASRTTDTLSACMKRDPR